MLTWKKRTISSPIQITDNYTKQTIDICKNSKNIVLGFVSQKKIANNDYLYLTPGVSVKIGTDNLDQRYRTPEEAKKHLKKKSSPTSLWAKCK